MKGPFITLGVRKESFVASSSPHTVPWRDLTDEYADRLPDGVTVVHDERLVVIPRATIVAAKKDVPDA
jgi:hypothetical protein